MNNRQNNTLAVSEFTFFPKKQWACGLLPKADLHTAGLIYPVA